MSKKTDEEIIKKLENNIFKDVGIIPMSDKDTFFGTVIWVCRKHKRTCIYIKEWMSGGCECSREIRIIPLIDINDALEFEIT